MKKQMLVFVGESEFRLGNRYDPLFPSFKVRSSGGVASDLCPHSSGVRRGGLELVNQTSGRVA